MTNEPTHGIKGTNGYWLSKTGGLDIICGSEGEMMAIVENQKKLAEGESNECDLTVETLPQKSVVPERAKSGNNSTGPYCSYSQLTAKIRESMKAERERGFWPLGISLGWFLWELFESENKGEIQYRIWGVPVVFDAALAPDAFQVT